ncbi:MAG: four helix bundle protein [Bacteroidales bacterium]|nr:four helix bundle protein [Bacteroidales bacterium]
MTKEELENRLIDYSVIIIDISENLKDSRAGNYFAGQVVRSGSSPALNYGEAQSAESKKDFLHKMKICLKELRETFVALKIIDRANLHLNYPHISEAMKESNELISIFVASVNTAESR